MALLWIIAVRIRDASHVDVAWAILIACAALAYALLADGDVAHRVLAAALASIWGFRLGLYLLFDRVLGKDEDGRYQALREKWGENANRNFFWFFQFQAALVVFFSLPYALVSLDPAAGLGVVEWAGAAVWAIGNAGVITSDCAARALAPRCGEQGQDGALRALVVVAAPQLLLRIRHLARGGAGGDGCAVGLAVLGGSGPAPLLPLPCHGNPRDGGAGASEPRGLRGVPADDERLRSAAAAPRR